jgi:hypothetical protein
MLIRRVSQLSGISHSFDINVDPGQLAAYLAGAAGTIQDALPNLHAWEREFIMTGITPKEWDEMFSPDDAVSLGSAPEDRPSPNFMSARESAIDEQAHYSSWTAEGDSWTPEGEY